MLNDQEVVRLLREHFVAVAIDNANNINLTPSERTWLKDKGGEFCTQGMSVFTAGGKVLGTGGGFEAGPNRRMLKEALAKFRPDEEPATVEALDAKDRATIPQPPEGGMVLFVTWKVLDYGQEAKPATPYDHLKGSLGVDRLWVRKDEAETLTAGRFPDSLKDRMIRYHVCSILRQVRAIDVTIKDGRLTGSFQRSDSGEPGSLLGFVESNDGKITRFDLLLKGMGEGSKDSGFLAGLDAVPKGSRVPVALFFSLADPHDDLSRLPPHRTWRALEAYLK